MYYYENSPKVKGANLLLSSFFRSKCPRTSRKLHICDRKLRALVGFMSPVAAGRVIGQQSHNVIS